jgi:hypothetical protein
VVFGKFVGVGLSGCDAVLGDAVGWFGTMAEEGDGIELSVGDMEKLREKLMSPCPNLISLSKKYIRRKK